MSVLACYRTPAPIRHCAVGALLGLLAGAFGCGESFEPSTPATDGGLGGGTPAGGSGGVAPVGGSGGGIGGTGVAGSTGVGGGGAGSTTGPCHPAGLEDGFDQAGQWPLWTPWVYPPAYNVTVNVADGVAFIQLPPSNTEQSVCGGFASDGGYDIGGCAVWIEVTRLLESSFPGGVFFGIWSGNPDSETGALCSIGQGVVRCGWQIGDEWQEDTVAATAPADHQWLRIREDGTHVTLETSGDGQSYAPVYVLPSATIPDVHSVRVEFFACVWDQTTMSARAELDNLDL